MDAAHFRFGISILSKTITLLDVRKFAEARIGNTMDTSTNKDCP